jgi:hypothetical protein
VAFFVVGALGATSQIIGGDTEGGLGFLGGVIVGGIVVVFHRRDELGRGHVSASRDERHALIDVRAIAFAGVVMFAVVYGAFLLEQARGADGDPYRLLLAVAFVSQVIAVVVLHRRS